MDLQTAYDEIQKRGWGFASNGEGFGDPASKWTAVGPWANGEVGGLIDVWGMDKDPIEAVRKALEREAKNGQTQRP